MLDHSVVGTVRGSMISPGKCLTLIDANTGALGLSPNQIDPAPMIKVIIDGPLRDS